MKTILAASIVTLALAGATAPDANAKGCLKGALVGGVAGHMAGHGVAGAAAGCAVGHHYANKKPAQNTSNPSNNNNSSDSNVKSH